MQEEYQPRISLTETYLLVGGALILETISIILVLFALPDFFIPGIIGFSSQLYFIMKGVPNRIDLYGSIGGLLPYADVIPFKTIGIIMTIWADYHPQSKLAEFAQKLQVRTQKGGVPTKTPVVKTPTVLKKAA